MVIYISLGDGGSANDPGNRAQNINENLGKILQNRCELHRCAILYLPNQPILIFLGLQVTRQFGQLVIA
jgi:hypothetical protein